MMRTDRAIVGAYLSRGARLWLGLRALIVAVLLIARADPLRTSTGVLVATILLTVAVGFVDTYRQGERILLGNLAVSPALLAVLFAAPAVVGEAALRVAAATLS